MLIQKHVKITIKNNIATLDEDLYFYRNDRNINILFEIYNFNFEFLNGTKENENNVTYPSYGTARVIKPNGQQIIIPKCPVENGLVHFYIDSELINDIDEIGIYHWVEAWNSACLSWCPRGERPLVELYLEPGGFFRMMHGPVTAASC